MISPSDVTRVRELLAAGRRRQIMVAASVGAAGGIGVALVAAIAGWPAHGSGFARGGVAALFAVAGAALWILWTRRTRDSLPLQIERRAPECRNLIITAAELLAQEERTDLAAGAHATEYPASLVFRDATRVAGTLNLAAVFPLRRALTALGLGIVLLAAVTVRALSPTSAPLLHTVLGSAAMISDIDVTVLPPPYTGEKERTLHNPARVQVLVGGKLQLTVRGQAAQLMLETLDGRQPVRTTQPGRFTAELVANVDGFLAFEPALNSGELGPRRLIGLSVTPDNAPRVKIVKPGRDLRMLDGNQTLDLAIEADDDIGLATLRLRYTKVSGSGERFVFTEGEVPIAMARTDARHWKANARWRLNPLELEAGDLVVYRAIVTDHRPGAAPTESDAYLAEVIAPGGVAASGFDVDTDLERYALSQQMVILKSERLLENRSRMTADSFAESSADLAIEQRSVRAEFVFMMGGEIAADPGADMNTLNEEAEAEGEADLAAGYSRNQGRDALLGAIRAMSRASGALTDVDVKTALTHERRALDQLQKAFSHTRILLRALTEHERLDLTRRMTGPLDEAGRDKRPGATPTATPFVSGLRQTLAGIAEVAARARLSSDDAAAVAMLAQAALRSDPSSQSLQQVSALLGEAAGALTRGRSDEARGLLDRAATALAATLRGQLSDAPPDAGRPETGQLNGTLRDALRRSGGGS